MKGRENFQLVILECGQPSSDQGSHTKKSLRHPKENEQARAEFEAKIKRYESEGKSIFYTDESGFAHESARTQGYSKKGTRCTDMFNWGANGRNSNLFVEKRNVLLMKSLLLNSQFISDQLQNNYQIFYNVA